MTDIITITDLHKSFGTQKVLDGVNLKIEKGKITIIIGKSGTGKSVLLKNIIGILKPDSGHITYKGEDITTFNTDKILDMRRDFGYLFQDAALFDFMNVGENIAFPMVEQLEMANKKELAEKVAYLLDLIDLPGIENKLPSELSGGMRKRVGLARALAVDPKIILFDEPTTGLDPILADSIDKLIVKVTREMDLTSLIISHDIPSAFHIGDKIAFLYDGVIAFDGTPQEAEQSNHPVLQRFIANSLGRRAHA
ncbi:ATP-binding cassette domain-containing protein [bacterium]|nr:ATP-binding cassette domain-containing protein [bacterium]